MESDYEFGLSGRLRSQNTMQLIYAIEINHDMISALKMQHVVLINSFTETVKNIFLHMVNGRKLFQVLFYEVTSLKNNEIYMHL